MLFNIALGMVPELSKAQLRTAHKRMARSWGDLELTHGSEEAIKDRLIQEISNEATSADFKVNVLFADKGYEGEEAAQLWVSGGERPTRVVHLWKTKRKVHAFGWAEFR